LAGRGGFGKGGGRPLLQFQQTSELAWEFWRLEANRSRRWVADHAARHQNFTAQANQSSREHICRHGLTQRAKRFHTELKRRHSRERPAAYLSAGATTAVRLPLVKPL